MKEIFIVLSLLAIVAVAAALRPSTESECRTIGHVITLMGECER